MSHRYSTALSHVFLAGTGIYCWSKIWGGGLHLTDVTFGVISVNSLLGIWRWGNPDYGTKVEGAYDLTTVTQKLFAMPCVTAVTWITYDYNHILAYLHPCVSLLPFVAYALSREGREETGLTDLLAFINCISLGVVSVLHENYYGLAASLTFAFAHFAFGTSGSTVSDIPSLDMYNYTMCFFTYFALKTLSGPKLE